jgi:hypothetical protein
VTIAPSVPKASIADSELPFPEVSQEHGQSMAAQADGSRLSVPPKVLAQELFQRAHRIVHQQGFGVVQAALNGLDAPHRAQLLNVLRSGLADPARARAEQPALTGFSDQIWSVLPELMPELGARESANSGEPQRRIQIGPVALLPTKVEKTLHGIAAGLNTAHLAGTIQQLRTLAESGFTHRDPVPEMLRQAQGAQEVVEAAAAQLLSQGAQLPTHSQLPALAIEKGAWRYDGVVDRWVNDTATTMPSFESWLAELAKPASAQVAVENKFPRHGLREPDAVTLQALAHEAHLAEEVIPKFIQAWLPLQGASLIQQESESYTTGVQKLVQEQNREIAAQQSELERLTVLVAGRAQAAIPLTLMDQVKVLVQRECLAHDTEFRAWKSRGVGIEPAPHFIYRTLWGADPIDEWITTEPLEDEAKARAALETLESKLSPLHRVGQRLADLDRLGRQRVDAQFADGILRDIQRVGDVAASELGEEIARTQPEVVETLRYAVPGVEAQPPQVRRALGKFLQGALQRDEWSLRGTISAGLPGLAESAVVDDLARVRAALVANPAQAPLVGAHLEDLFRVVLATPSGDSELLRTARREVAQVVEGKEVNPDLLKSLEDLSRGLELRVKESLPALSYGALPALQAEAERLHEAGVPGAHRLSGLLSAARVARLERTTVPAELAQVSISPQSPVTAAPSAPHEASYHVLRTQQPSEPYPSNSEVRAAARGVLKAPSPARPEFNHDPEELYGAFCVMVDLRAASLHLQSNWEDYHSDRQRAKYLLGVFHETINQHLPMQPAAAAADADSTMSSPNIVRDLLGAIVGRINELYGASEEGGVDRQPERHVEALSEVLENQLRSWQQRAARYEPEELRMAAAVAARRGGSEKATGNSHLEAYLRFLNQPE